MAYENFVIRPIFVASFALVFTGYSMIIFKQSTHNEPSET